MENANKDGCSYIQVLSPKINLKIKENFSNLFSKKIENIHKITNEPKKEEILY